MNLCEICEIFLKLKILWMDLTFGFYWLVGWFIASEIQVRLEIVPFGSTLDSLKNHQYQLKNLL